MNFWSELELYCAKDKNYIGGYRSRATMADEVEDEDKLKLYWEHFFRAETGTYEVKIGFCSLSTI